MNNMKRSYLIIPFLILILMGCSNREQDTQEDLEYRIKKVENNLCSPIILGSNDSSFYSIAERMDFHKVPGFSVAIINNGKIEWCKGYGVLNSDNQKRINSETLFQAGSISKPVTALGALNLVESGELDLDRNINEYFRAWKLPDNEFTEDTCVTLRYLLCHGAGINGHMLGAYSQKEQIPTIKQLLNGQEPAVKDPVRVVQIPQQEFLYSGGGYLLSLLAMEETLDCSFKEIMEENILKVIGMKRSGFYQPLKYDSLNNVASGHDEDGKPYLDHWLTFPNLAEGGLWTTPKELSLFVIEIDKALEGESSILSKELAKEMLRIHIGSYGLGFIIGKNKNDLTFSHGGDSRGYHNYLYYNISQKKGVVIMTNSQNGAYLFQELLRSIALTYNWSDFQPRVINPVYLEPEELDLYCGRYVFNDIIYTTITKRNNILQMKGDDGRVFNLYPIDKAHFIDKISGWEITFDIDQDKIINGITVNVGGLKLNGTKV